MAQPLRGTGAPGLMLQEGLQAWIRRQRKDTEVELEMCTPGRAVVVLDSECSLKSTQIN
jgi:hypothetical protein